MPQQIKFSEDVRQSLKRGVDTVANAVKSTLGPGGKVVSIVKEHYTVTTKDGVTVAKAIELEDKYENVGAAAVREAAEKTNQLGGDGTTVTSVVVQAEAGGAFSAVDSGASPVALKLGIKKATDFVCNYLEKLSTPIDTLEQIQSVASISANDKEMGGHIASLFHKLGKEGIIVVEESKSVGYEEEYIQGLQWDKPLLSPYMFTDFLRRKAEINNPYILLTDKPIDNQEVIKAFLMKIAQEGESKTLVVVADDFLEDGLKALVANHKNIANPRTGERGQFLTLAVRAPYAGPSMIDALEDMAALLGAEVFSKDKGVNLPTSPEEVDLSKLGRADKIISDPQRTVIIGGRGRQKDIKARATFIKNQLKKEDREWEKTKLKERLARLTGQVAILRFGAENESATKEAKYRIEDSINATRNALEEGIVPGGEIALLKASLALNLKADGDEARGIEIVRQALQQPLKVLAENAGESGNGVLKRVIEGQKVSKNFGWDAAKDEYGDMIEKGIIDPVKVVKSAIQNASATVGLLLLTDCIITDIPEVKIEPKPGKI